MLTIYMSKIYEPVSILAILIASIFGMKALFHPGLFTAHDIYHQIVRIYYYYQSTIDGQFPPYWISDLASGYGYPLFFFSYHLPWILSLPFLYLGVGFPITIKVIFFLGFLLSGSSMYYFCKAIFQNRLAALISSILYLWAPYHFMTIFVGASVGVVYAFIFLPLILLGIHLSFQNKLKGLVILAISIAGLILAHFLHAIYFLPTIIIFFIWELLMTKPILLLNASKWIASGLLLAILLSSFYLIPAFYYRNYTYAPVESGFSSLYKRNFINLSQLIYSKWGFGPIINNAKNGEISFQLGISQWISLMMLILIIVFRKINKNLKKLGFIILIGVLINIFLLLNYSIWFWKIFEKIIVIDYPFRFIAALVFLSSFSIGVVLASINKNAQKILFTIILILTFYTNRNHLNVNLYTDIPVEEYLNSETTITTNTFHEYTPIKADRSLINKKGAPFVSPDLPVENIKQETTSIDFDIETSRETNISVKQFSFPGLNTYIDQVIVQTSIDKKGLINIHIPTGKHHIKIRFEETPLIKFSKILSVIGIILTLAILFRIFLSRNK
ncbi:hypothetical protein A3H40_04125 [Candidatus Daviesbacteria bacterium RIFCSPLOWO2_02_FULL_38_15]|uniref:Membrane protein 6-pyruvoyl-tetrahydropterin synthase-related domain-containing protein n=1 Tax=Candidatus Daviesbacteria bacterium RIFCSPLOWO2_02_FULL_38_15 TaxID=1797794 RepID=A0A1F5N4A5_9BACT|nr:MAG: hypothetical protein A3H40_04125 [Candidatus Daviesbacteria bacterium RIFCSPLOWO2_02_FULL_38_15]